MRCEKDVVLFIRDERVLLLLSALYDATIHPPKRGRENFQGRKKRRASCLIVVCRGLLAHLLSFSDNHSCKHFIWAFWVSNLERKGSRELLPFMELYKCHFKADSNWLDSWRQNLGYLDQFRNNSWMFEFQLDIKVQSTVRFGNGFVKRIL